MEKQNDMEYIKFKQIYEDAYNSCKPELNAIRIKYVIKMAFTIIFSIFIILSFPYLVTYFNTNEQFLYYYNKYNTYFVLIHWILIFMVIFILSQQISKCKEKLDDIFKTKILSKLFANLLLNVINIDLGCIPFFDMREYKNIKFDNKRFGRFEVENYIKGTLKSNCIMQMMYVCTYKFATNRYKEVYCNYSGHYLVIDKKFDSELRIYTKARRKDLKEELVISDNMIFNDNFKIYCSQNDIVQKYLTNELMNCLLNFKEKYKMHFDLVLKDKVYIRFHTLNLLEPIFFGSIIDRSLYKIYAIIKFAEDLVKILDKADGLPQ